MIIVQGKTQSEIKEVQSVQLASKNIRMITPRYYNYLTELDVSNNPISWLPYMESVRCIRANNTKLTTVLYYPNLEQLYIQDCLVCCIASMPKLCILDCSNNLLQCLPKLPLTKLVCNNNPLASIQGSTLTSLEAYRCPINTLHYIPGLLRRSTLLDNTSGKISVVQTITAGLDRQNVLVNWITGCCDAVVKPTLLKSIESALWQTVWEDVFNLLFYS